MKSLFAILITILSLNVHAVTWKLEHSKKIITLDKGVYEFEVEGLKCSVTPEYNHSEKGSLNPRYSRQIFCSKNQVRAMTQVECYAKDVKHNSGNLMFTYERSFVRADLTCIPGDNK